MEEPLNNSAEWESLRPKLITSSQFHRVLNDMGMSKRGMEFGAGAIRYALEIACFMLTGEPPKEKSSAEIEWGREHEEFARQEYERIKFCTVQPGRLIRKPDTMIGASPDGFVGDDGLIEIKCPTSVVHLQTLIDGNMPPYHKPQVQGQLWVTGRKWVDFVSYDPRFKDPDKRLFIKRVEREEVFITNMSMILIRFQDFVLQMARHGQESTYR